MTDNDLLAGLRNGAWLNEQAFPPVQYSVPGLIPEGGVILVGPPKIGKSYLILDLLLAVAAGGYALGSIPIEQPSKVLYLALEDGDRRIQRRCQQILSDQPIPEDFHYLTKVERGASVATIDAFLQQHPDTRLVVLDTLGKVMPPALPGQSAYERDYAVAGHLKAIADRHPGLSLVIIHHVRKSNSTEGDFVDAVSGTNGLAGALDATVVLSRRRGQEDAILKVTGRDVEEGEYALDFNGGLWQLAGNDLKNSAEIARTRQASNNLGDRSSEILAVVREHPSGITPAQVASELSGIDNNTAGTYLRRLADGGYITRVGRGRFAPTSPLAPRA